MRPRVANRVPFWAAAGRAKQPWYFTLVGGDPIESCALITTEANGVVGPVHDRMPVLLHPDDYDRWLDPGARPEALRALLQPYPDEEMVAQPVSRLVNDARRDDPSCIEPAA